MLKNYFNTILRNIKRRKLFTFINIVGLSLGITCAIIIYLIITFETSFDKHHDDYDKIYRIVGIDDSYGETKYRAGVPYPLVEAFKVDFPEIEDVVITDANFWQPVIAVTSENGEKKRFKEKKGVIFVGDKYFDIFKYEWIYGDKEKAFDKVNSVVISEKYAMKYFGRTDVIGEMITYNNAADLIVTAVVKDVPKTTELPFNVLISFDNFSFKRSNDKWTSISSPVQCYIKLPGNISVKSIEERLKDFVVKHYPEGYSEHTTIQLQKLSEVHYDDRFYNYSGKTVSKNELAVLGVIGILIVLMSCVNFINLNTAMAFKHSVEVGVRKVLGGTKAQLVLRFLGESALLTFSAVVIAFLLTESFLPNIDFITHFQLSFGDFDLLTLALFSISLFLIITLLSGLYPAFYLSRFNPIRAIKNDLNESYKNGWSLKRLLIVFQFSISQALLIAAIVVIYQIDYVRTANLGFEKEGIIEVTLPQNDENKLSTLKNKLNSHPFIDMVTFSSTGVSSGNLWWGTAQLFGEGEPLEFEGQVKYIDKKFESTYGLEFIIGNNITENDSLNNFIVNEEFVKAINLGNNYADAIGLEVKIWRYKGPIVGVVKNFNYTSLHEEIQPLMMTYAKKHMWTTAIKLKASDLSNAVAQIKSDWESVYPEFVFEFEFLDKSLQKFYEEEERLSTTFNVFCFVAVLIGCMGLFGLSSFMAERRSKEIGIRKVLGATLSSIVSLVSSDFLKLIIISNVLGSIAAYLLMDKWLQNFAFKVNIEWWIFTSAFLLSILITLVTTSYQSLKAALSNPVEALKYE